MRARQAFALIELLVVISIIALLIGILLPALGAARRTALRLENSTQLRGIQQAMFQFAQGNAQRFPGMGKNDVISAGGRLEILLDGNLFIPRYIISPFESTKTPQSTSITTDNFSYALLDIDTAAAGRRNAWQSNANSEVPVIFDRNTAPGTSGSDARSYHASNDWRGGVAYNDNHVAFETSNILERTRFANQSNLNDDLFKEDGHVGTNALGVYDSDEGAAANE